jgi:hypothetical protein
MLNIGSPCPRMAPEPQVYLSLSWRGHCINTQTQSSAALHCQPKQNAAVFVCANKQTWRERPCVKSLWLAPVWESGISVVFAPRCPTKHTPSFFPARFLVLHSPSALFPLCPPIVLDFSFSLLMDEVHFGECVRESVPLSPPSSLCPLQPEFARGSHAVPEGVSTGWCMLVGVLYMAPLCMTPLYGFLLTFEQDVGRQRNTRFFLKACVCTVENGKE